MTSYGRWGLRRVRVSTGSANEWHRREARARIVIHYHGLPMTPTADMLRAMRGRHAMVSFEHPQQMEEAAEVCQSVVLDNGAFSAWRARRTHDFSGYQAWAANWLRHPAVDWCVIPDVIDGDEKANDGRVWPRSWSYCAMRTAARA